MKNKIIVTVLTSLLLVGCGTKTVVVEKPVVQTNPSYETPSMSYTSSEQIYLDTIRSEYPYVVSSMGEEWVVDFGGIACNAIDSGLTINGIAELATQNGVDPRLLGFLIGAAIPVFCPYNMWFIEGI